MVGAGAEHPSETRKMMMEMVEKESAANTKVTRYGYGDHRDDSSSFDNEIPEQEMKEKRSKYRKEYNRIKKENKSEIQAKVTKARKAADEIAKKKKQEDDAQQAEFDSMQEWKKTLKKAKEPKDIVEWNTSAKVNKMRSFLSKTNIDSDIRVGPEAFREENEEDEDDDDDDDDENDRKEAKQSARRSSLRKSKRSLSQVLVPNEGSDVSDVSEGTGTTENSTVSAGTSGTAGQMGFVESLTYFPMEVANTIKHFGNDIGETYKQQGWFQVCELFSSCTSCNPYAGATSIGDKSQDEEENHQSRTAENPVEERNEPESANAQEGITTKIEEEVPKEDEPKFNSRYWIQSMARDEEAKASAQELAENHMREAVHQSYGEKKSKSKAPKWIGKITKKFKGKKTKAKNAEQLVKSEVRANSAQDVVASTNLDESGNENNESQEENRAELENANADPIATSESKSFQAPSIIPDIDVRTRPDLKDLPAETTTKSKDKSEIVAIKNVESGLLQSDKAESMNNSKKDSKIAEVEKAAPPQSPDDNTKSMDQMDDANVKRVESATSAIGGGNKCKSTDQSEKSFTKGVEKAPSSLPGNKSKPKDTEENTENTSIDRMSGARDPALTCNGKNNMKKVVAKIDDESDGSDGDCEDKLSVDADNEIGMYSELVLGGTKKEKTLDDDDNSDQAPQEREQRTLVAPEADRSVTSESSTRQSSLPTGKSPAAGGAMGGLMEFIDDAAVKPLKEIIQIASPSSGDEDNVLHKKLSRVNMKLAVPKIIKK